MFTFSMYENHENEQEDKEVINSNTKKTLDKRMLTFFVF